VDERCALCIVQWCLVGTGFQTPKLHRTVRASELAYHSRGDYQADYLTVEHNTVVDLRDEFILLGRETPTDKVHYMFTLIAMSFSFLNSSLILITQNRFRFFCFHQKPVSH